MYAASVTAIRLTDRRAATCMASARGRRGRRRWLAADLVALELPAPAFTYELIVVVGDDRDLKTIVLRTGGDPRAAAEPGRGVALHVDGLIHHEMEVVAGSGRTVLAQEPFQELPNRSRPLRRVAAATDELSVLGPEQLESCPVAVVQRAGITDQERANRLAIFQDLQPSFERAGRRLSNRA